MSFLKNLFGTAEPDPKTALQPLYTQIVDAARQQHWYIKGGVPDTVDGRFAMVSAILSLVVLRLEKEKEHMPATARLTEIFVEDMDGQLREFGVGDMIVGKHIGRLMSALGGRLGAFRAAFEDDADPAILDDVIMRNIYDGEDNQAEALGHVRTALRRLAENLAKTDSQSLLAAKGSWA